MIYALARIFIAPWYRLWLRSLEGMENLPRDRPFIMAVNHQSYYETALIHSIIVPVLGKKIHALVNGAYWNHSFSKMFLDYSECIPVMMHKGRKSKKHNLKSLEKAAKYLKKATSF